MLVDEDLSDTLTMLLCVFHEQVQKGDVSLITDPDFPKWNRAIQALLESRVDIIHKLGWCKDTDCQYVKPEDRNKKRNEPERN